MKRFLLIPSCALLALGMLTSCQKEDKTAKQLADELTAELQTVTDYKTAEAAAPRVEALNKRFQNANARVFSVGGNALAASGSAYAESVDALAKEIGRVRASKPVTEADSETIDDTRLIRAIGVSNGAAVTAPAREQLAKGQTYLYNDSSEKNADLSKFAECYGSASLAAALDYKPESGKFGLFYFDSAEDCPAIPAATEVPASDDDSVSADDVTPADDSTPAVADDAEDDTATTTAADEDTTPAPTATGTSSSSSSDDDDELDLGDDDDDSSSSSSSDDDDDLSIDDDL